MLSSTVASASVPSEFPGGVHFVQSEQAAVTKTRRFPLSAMLPWRGVAMLSVRPGAGRMGLDHANRFHAEFCGETPFAFDLFQRACSLASCRMVTAVLSSTMSISELLPAIRSLTDLDKLQLIRVLAEDLTDKQQSPLDSINGSMPVWTPHNAFEAADTLFLALQNDDQPLTAHA